jgi:uncharacterized hydrophobic protein (TIGR00271 family)
MYHLRIVAPHDRSSRVLELLEHIDSVINVIFLEDAARNPQGDVILADVAREDASVVLSDLRELGLESDGSIALEAIDSAISHIAQRAEKAAKGAPSDAVIWEQVEFRTSEESTLSASYLAFIILATLIASVGLLLDSPILIVGAMVVGPEFGPIAALCVALVEKRRRLAVRSFIALAVGFPAAISATYLITLLFKSLDLPPETFSFDESTFAHAISNPDFFAFFVAFCAGVAGTLSLTTAKSGALIGVLISVTTIPAAAAIAVAAAYQDGDAWSGSVAQLAVNLAMIVTAGVATLYLQRLLYLRRRREHLHEDARRAAGLPLGRSRRSGRRAAEERNPV